MPRLIHLFSSVGFACTPRSQLPYWHLRGAMFFSFQTFFSLDSRPLYSRFPTVSHCGKIHYRILIEKRTNATPGNLSFETSFPKFHVPEMNASSFRGNWLVNLLQRFSTQIGTNWQLGRNLKLKLKWNTETIDETIFQFHLRFSCLMDRKKAITWKQYL